MPTIAGAGLLKSLDLARSGDAALGTDAAIVIALSAGFAWLAISWMMRWLAKASFGIFVYYRIALGTFLLGPVTGLAGAPNQLDAKSPPGR